MWLAWNCHLYCVLHHTFQTAHYSFPLTHLLAAGTTTRTRDALRQQVGTTDESPITVPWYREILLQENGDQKSSCHDYTDDHANHNTFYTWG